MLLVLNEWLFHDLLNENGAVAFQETAEFTIALERSADRLVVPDEPRWLEKAYRLMTRSDPRQRLISQLLHRMLLDPGRAIRVHGDPTLWQPGNQHSQIPDEDVYLAIAYSIAGADLLVTTDEGLFVALADNEDVDCQMRGEFLFQYLRHG